MEWTQTTEPAKQDFDPNQHPSAARSIT